MHSKTLIRIVTVTVAILAPCHAVIAQYDESPFARSRRGESAPYLEPDRGTNDGSQPNLATERISGTRVEPHRDTTPINPRATVLPLGDVSRDASEYQRAAYVQPADKPSLPQTGLPTRATRVEPKQPAESGAVTESSSQGNKPNGALALPLAPPDSPEDLKAPPTTPGGAIWTVVTSLTVVLGLFFALAYVGRRARPGGSAILPTEAFEVLGRAPLNGRQQAQLVRLGDKLILLAVSSNGVEPIGEVTTPDEVDRLAGLCRQNQADSVSTSFRQVLGQFAREPAPASFVGEGNAPGAAADEEEPISEFERLA